MTIQAGDRLPEVPLQRIRDGIETVDTGNLFEGRKMVIFAVPGAFTPTCSEKHLPGFVAHFDEFRDKGVGVACLAVNDPFVMQAWGQSQHVPDGLLMLADGKQGMMAGHWWLTVLPGTCIMLMVLSANLLGDWLRVKLDPQLRQL